MQFVRALVYGLSSFFCFYLGKFGAHDGPLLIVLLGIVAIALGIVSVYQLLDAVSSGIITLLKSMLNKQQSGYRRRARPAPRRGAVTGSQVPVVTGTDVQNTVLPASEQTPVVVQILR